ncbi:MAG TPA: response regulator [Spirochaetota bacterium]|nr:response regulator [Spirochaetota bacterium]HPS87381.1 response regulator [Spirochaetota bacterium]
MKIKSSKKKILIVEDQLIIAMDLKLTLEGLGYDVTGIAGTAEECFQYFEKEKPDLVLMDIMLSGNVDGIYAAEVIHKDFDVPIIYLTAHSDDNSLLRANLTGPYGYIVKPIEERDLYTSIEIALHRFSIDKELKKSEIKYRTLFEQSLDPIFIADESAVIIDANQAMIDLFEYPLKGIIGHNSSEFFYDYSEYQAFIYLAEQTGAVSDFECRMRSKSGKVIDVQITLTKYDYGKEQGGGYQGIIRDITQYKLYFEELIKSRQELRNLTSHIESLREKERTDIAREIHDVLGQSLTALKIDLSWMRKKLNPDEKDLIEKTTVMDGLINDVIVTVRRLSASLRPGILDDLGLAAAIEWQSEEFRKRTGFTCCVNCEEISNLSEEKAVALFRIFQESLTNIIKHSNADRVDISLGKNHGNIEMMIKDNGRGFSSENLISRGSYGIIGMRERVKSFNGTLEISGSDKGVSVHVLIPM